MIVVSNIFLCNFSIIMVHIRKDIKNKVNIDIISILLEVFGNNLNNNNMCADIASINVSWYRQLKHEDENSITYNVEYYNQFIADTLLFLMYLLSSQQYEMAYQIVDILHILPDVILKKGKKSKKDFWKTFIIPFEENNNISFFKKMKKRFFNQ